MKAKEFYRLFTPLKSEMVIPNSLKEYADGLAEHHQGVKITYMEDDNLLDAELFKDDLPVIEDLDEKKAVILFSSGVDSTWSLIEHIKLGYEVYPVFIKMLNPAISSKELKAVNVLKEKLNLNLTVIEHPKDLRLLHKDQYLSDQIDKESVVKNQYALLLLVNLIREHKIGTVICINDHIDDGSITMYSDTPKAYHIFEDVLRKQVGGGLKFSHITVPRKEKVKVLLDMGLFEYTASCYMREMFFKAHYNKQKPPFKNMCGVCVKCKWNLQIFKELQ